MLGRPAALRPRAVVVGPDDLVEEALAPEELVEQRPSRSAPRAGRGGRRASRGRRAGAARARSRGRRNAGVVVERVGVARRRAADLRTLPGVERRVDVDQVERAVGQPRQQRRGCRPRGPGRRSSAIGSPRGDSASLGGRDGPRQTSIGSSALVAVLVLAAWAAAALLSAATTTTAPVARRAGRRASRGRPPDPFAVRPRADADASSSSARGRRASHVALRQEPGRRGRHAPSASRATARSSRRSPTRPTTTPTRSRRSSSSRAPGRPDARAGGDREGAVGLTQILAETGQNLLDMRVDVARSARLTRRIARAERRGAEPARRAAARAAPARRRALRPAEGARGHRALPDFAKGELDGRDDLAVASLPHGRRQPAERARRRSAPTTTRRTPRSSSTRARCATATAYAAARLARRRLVDLPVAGRGGAGHHARWRDDPGALAVRAARMHGARTRPRSCCTRSRTREVFAEPEAIETALDDGDLDAAARRGLRAARRAHRPPHGRARRAARTSRRALYRGAAPRGARAARLPGPRRRRRSAAASRSSSRARCATSATSACSLRRNPEATHGYSLHTTG